MNEYVIKHGYKVAKSLYNLVEHEILPGTGIDAENFWQSLGNIFDEFTPKNEALLVMYKTRTAATLLNGSPTMSRPLFAIFLLEASRCPPLSSATVLPSKSCSSASQSSSLLCSGERLSCIGIQAKVWMKWSLQRLNPT